MTLTIKELIYRAYIETPECPDGAWDGNKWCAACLLKTVEKILEIEPIGETNV